MLYLNAFFQVFVRNPIFRLVWFMGFAIVLFTLAGCAMGMSSLLIRVFGLAPEYEELLTPGSFLVVALIAGWAGSRVYRRYTIWRAVNN